MTASEMEIRRFREIFRSAQRLLWFHDGTPREIREAREAEWEAQDAAEEGKVAPVLSPVRGKTVLPRISTWQELELRLLPGRSKVADELAFAIGDACASASPTKVRVLVANKDYGLWAYSDLHGFIKECENDRPPNSAWKLLLALADAGSSGIPAYKRGGKRDGAVKSSVARLNRALSSNFTLSTPAVSSGANNFYLPKFTIAKPPRVRDFSDGEY